MMLTFGSLFSGIGGFDLGLERAGMECKWQVENDKFCNEILTRHWPDVPKYGDISAVDFSGLERVDMVCGGFPCQDLSVAGNRAGLAGERSQLFWEAIRCVRVLEPRWVLIENVPGLFSSQSGRDFGLVISALDELGYGVAWRVLDSQNFGVAQRRRRVFIVGHLGSPCPLEVLFEPDSLSGNTATIGKKGEDTSHALVTSSGKFDPTIETYAIAFSGGNSASARGIGYGVEQTPPIKSADSGSNQVPVISAPTDPDRVRDASGLPDRLDPEERPEPDSPRYKALGNAVTVNVAEWIGRRIADSTLT